MVLWFCDHPQWTTLNMNGKTDEKSWKSSLLITYTNLYLIHTPQPTSKRKDFKTDKKRYKSVQKRKVQHLYQKDRGISLGNLKSWGPWNKKNSNQWIWSNQGNNFGSKNTILIYRYLELYYLYDLNCLSILIVFLTKVLI